MIKIKDLTVRNFMSVGNQTQAVDFDKQQLTLVLGENLDQGGDDTGSRNGTGKTTIINALSYALYGNALTNIKRNNLINKTNSKGMLVTLSFEKDNLQYRIERGRSPNILKFYINNEEQVDIDESQGDSRKTQESIDTLLGMSHNMFKHVVALNTYTEPFLSMRVNDQRDIIEQLLGITILSEKADILKEDIKVTKDKLSQETMRINALQTANEKIDETIVSLQSKQKAWLSKRTTDVIKLKEAIDEFEHLDIEKELKAHEQLTKLD
jgi:DNA repair exonuclease SbcCD ATPase subunit